MAPEDMLTQSQCHKKFWRQTGFCCRTSSLRQMQDVSVDRTETYEPLSGKVMLGRWLKWKLCANIYTGLMSPLASATPPEPHIPIARSMPACSPMLRADTHFGSAYPIYFTANRAKQWNCSFGHTLAETRPIVKLNLDSVDSLRRRKKRGDVSNSKSYKWALLYMRRLNSSNCLIALRRGAGGYLAATDRQML